MSSIICLNCQASNAGNRSFCFECGQRFDTSAAQRLAAGFAGKVRGDDLKAADARAQSHAAAVERYFANERPAQPSPAPGGLFELIAGLGLISGLAGVGVGLFFNQWGAVDMSASEAARQSSLDLKSVIAGGDPLSWPLNPWTVEYAWLLGLATGIQLFVIGFILVTLGRIYSATMRSSAPRPTA